MAYNIINHNNLFERIKDKKVIKDLKIALKDFEPIVKDPAITFGEDDKGDGFFIDRKFGRFIFTEHVSALDVPKGKKLKKPQAYISKIERGERRIDAVELEELARVYDKDINYFVK